MPSAMMNRLEEILLGIFAALVTLSRLLLQVPKSWFERYVFWTGAPFRAVEGPYVLVLRSFSNRMGITRLGYRIVIDRTGSLAPMPDFMKQMPYHTLYHFLTVVKERSGEQLVSVSSGTSVDGALTLFSAPHRRWFEAVTILAAHAKAIISIPDDSAGLAQEMKFAITAHPLKLVVLMPPTESEPSEVHDGYLYRRYVLDPVDMAPAWEAAAKSLAQVGVELPSYAPTGKIVTFQSDGSVAPRMDAWRPEVLASHIGEPRADCGDGRSARKALREAGFYFRRYPLASGVDPDPTWNRPDFDVRLNFARLQNWVDENDARGEE